MTDTHETMVVTSDKKNLQQTEQKALLLTQGIKNNYSYSFTWEMLKQQSIFTQVHTNNLFHLMVILVAVKIVYGIWYLLVMVLYSRIIMVTDLCTYSSTISIHTCICTKSIIDHDSTSALCISADTNWPLSGHDMMDCSKFKIVVVVSNTVNHAPMDTALVEEYSQ